MKTMNLFKKSSYVLFVMSSVFYFLLVSCGKNNENVEPVDSNEALTSVELQLVDSANTSDTVKAVIKFDAVTGEITDSSKAILSLKAQSVYTSTVILLDTTQTPTVDATEEITERANEHLFFYQPLPMASSVFTTGATSAYIPGTVTSNNGPFLNLTVVRTDYDTQTPPLQLGLKAKFATGAASTGRLRVVLRHQPNAKNGQYAPGSTDLDVYFSVEIGG